MIVGEGVRSTGVLLYYNVANAKKKCFVIDVEIKFHLYHSMHDVNVIK